MKQKTIFRDRVLPAVLSACFLWAASSASAAPGDRSPDGAWSQIEETQLDAKRAASATPWIRPDKFAAFELDAAGLGRSLGRAPMEFSDAARNGKLTVSVPLPEGGFERFELVETRVAEQGLYDWMDAQGFPMRTYKGQSLDTPATSIRLDIGGPAGFHARVLSPAGEYWVDPYWQGDDRLYASYRRQDYSGDGQPFGCEVTESFDHSRLGAAGGFRTGPQLRTYRLAMAATGEYTTFHGGSQAQGQAAIVTAVNRINMPYERDLGVRMVLVANNMNIVFTNAGSDPYTDGNTGTMLGQNQTTCDGTIGSANYDVGHVVGASGSGGLAGLGVVCSAGNKAQGATTRSNPVGDAFDIDFTAHELGHQFSGNHTFNGDAGSCAGGNRNGPTAHEPGSGSTIQAYAGICGPDNDIQQNSDAMFSAISIQEMGLFIDGETCHALAGATNANAPTVSAGADFTIPANTPFELTATGSDMDGDTVTYSWEQVDVNGTQIAPGTDTGNNPLMRAFLPKTSPSRTFPDPVAGASLGETLPTVNSRTMTMRVVARDNNANVGRTSVDDMTLTVTTAVGPLAVTAPNGGEVVAPGSSMMVTWNGSDTALLSPNVDIALSLDGGATYSTMLASGTPNDGSQMVTLPGSTSNAARVRVKAASNVFLDASDTSFLITNDTVMSYDNTTTASIAGCGSPVTRVINVPDSLTISDINFGLNVTTGFRGVMQASITSPMGTTVALTDFVGSDGDANIDVLFDSDSSNAFDDGNSDDTSAPLYDRSAMPFQSLTAFNGQNAQGNWTLSICDGSASVGGTFNSARLTVTEMGAAPAPAFSINDVTMDEGNSGSTAFSFTVSASPTPTSTVTVDFATADGTATTANLDYAPSNGTLTFNAGESSMPVAVQVVGDATVEPDENFVVNLSNATGGATIADNQGTGTITNDDAAGASPILINEIDADTAGTDMLEFVELFNTSGMAYDFSQPGQNHLLVLYNGSSDTSYLAIDINTGILAPGGFLLLGNAAVIPAPAFTFPDNTLQNGADGVALYQNRTSAEFPTGTAVSTMNLVDAAVYDTDDADDTGLLTGLGVDAQVNENENGDKDNQSIQRGGPGANTWSTANVGTPTPGAANITGGGPSLSINDVTVNEGGGVATFTVTASAAVSGDTSVDVAIMDLSTTAADYMLLTPVATILDGNTTADITVAIVDDGTVETDEIFIVNLTNPTNGASIGDGQGQGTITDNDATPTPMLSIGDAMADEDAGTMTFTISSDIPVLADTMVDVAATDGTASNLFDFLFAPGQATIPLGMMSTTVDVPITDDMAAEGDETFTMTISNPTAGAAIADATATGTIVDNDGGTGRLDFDDATGATIDGGTTCDFNDIVVSFLVPDMETVADVDFGFNADHAFRGDIRATLMSPMGTSVVIITNSFDDDLNYDVLLDDDAGAPLDNNGTDDTAAPLYDRSAAPSNPLSAFNGEPTQGVWTLSICDSFSSSDNGFYNSSRLSILPAVAGAANISVDDVTVNEGDGTAMFTISSDIPVASDVTVQVDTADGTANIIADYLPVFGGMATITAGNTTATMTVNVTIQDDANIESDETVLLNLSNVTGPAVIADAQGVCTIQDNDGAGAANISIMDATANEGDGVMTFTIMADANVTSDVTLSVNTAPDTAVAGADYTAISGGSATIASGTNSTTVDVAINDDLAPESAEDFTVTIAVTSGPGQIADGTATGTITDNDAPPCEMGGPDSFGYTFADSNCMDGPAFNFIDISGTGTDLGLVADDSAGLALLGFTFNYYGSDFSAVSVASNGYLTFGGATDSFTDNALPDTNRPDNLIGLFWDDLSTDPSMSGGFGGGTIYTETIGSAPNRVFIAQYQNVLHRTFAGGGADSGVYQAQLFEGTNEIQFHYQSNMASGAGNNTVAIQNGDGTIGLTYKSDGSSLITPLAISFAPPAAPTAMLSVNDISVSEDGIAASFTISSNIPVASDVTVDFATSDDTAMAGEDYTATMGTATILAGNTTATMFVDVPIIDDADMEDAESFFLNLSNVTGPAMIADGSGIGTITDNDTPLDIVLSADDFAPGAADDGNPDNFTMFCTNPGMLTIQLDGVGSQTFDIAMVNSVQINGSGDDDFLNIQQALDQCSPLPVGGIGYVAGGQQTAMGDGLRIAIGFRFTSTYTQQNFSDGIIAYDGALIVYQGLEPIIDMTPVMDRVFNFDGGAESIILSDDGTPGDDVSFIDSTQAESVTFLNPTNSLTINAGDGDDTIDVFALDSMATLPGGLFVNGGSDDDDIIVDASAVYATSVDGGVNTGSDGDEIVYALGGGALTGDLSSGAISGSGLMDVSVANVEQGVGFCKMGTDAGGYQLEDSNCGAIAANFIDISGTGADTGLSGDDDRVQVALGFTFNYYGVDFTDAFVSANGLLAMGTTNPGLAFTNTVLPSASAPNDVIAPFWDDLDLTGGGSVFTETQGTSPNQVFIAQWTNVPHRTSGIDSGLFQVQLFEGTNEIQFHYSGVTADSDLADAFTIGIENGDGTQGTTYVLGTATPLPDPFAVSFLPGGTPPVNLSIDDATVDETAGMANFLVTTDAPVASDVTFNFATMDGTATAGSDYTASSGMITIMTGNSSASLSVAILDDAVFEGDETFTVELSNVTGPATIADGSGLGTITDDETPPLPGNDDFANRVVLTGMMGSDTGDNTNATAETNEPDPSCDQGGGGNVTSIWWSWTAPGDGDATFDTFGSAGIGDSVLSLYTGTDLTDLVEVACNDDAAGGGLLSEATFTATNGTEYFVRVAGFSDTGGNQGAVTLNYSLMAAGAPTLSIDDVSVDENAGTATFTITASSVTTDDVTVQVDTADGTATAGADYTAIAAGTATILTGNTTTTVDVAILDDAMFEGDETFTVTLSNVTGTATIADGTGTGTITDDETPPAPANDDFANRIVLTGMSGSDTGDNTNATAEANEPVIDSGCSNGGAITSIWWSWTAPDNGDATFDTTGSMLSGNNDSVLSIYTGADLMSLAEVACDDDSSPSGLLSLATFAATSGTEYHVRVAGFSATPGTNEGPVTLNYNLVVAGTPELSIDDVSVDEDAGAATFTITASAAVATDVMVQVDTADGSAEDENGDGDYAAIVAGTATIQAGTTTATVMVTINDDAVFEGDETFTVNLSNVTGGPATIADGTGVGTIVDNEFADVNLSVLDAYLEEGDSGASTLTFTIVADGPAGADVMVQVDTADGTATIGDADYDQVVGLTVTLPMGADMATFDVTINGDATDEDDEAFTVTLSNVSGPAMIVNDTATGFIVTDDFGGALSYNDVPGDPISIDDAANCAAGTPIVRTITVADDVLIGDVNFGFNADHAFRSDIRVTLASPAGTVVNVIDMAGFDGNDNYDLVVDDDSANPLDNALDDDTALPFFDRDAAPTNPLSAFIGQSSMGDWTVTICDDFATSDDGFYNLSRLFITELAAGTSAISIDDVTVNEFDGTATFTITANPAASADIMVDFATMDGSAEDENGAGDYASATGTAMIAMGSTTATVDVTINDDAEVEGTENFFVNLSNLMGPAILADASGLGTILDDEFDPDIVRDADDLGDATNDGTPDSFLLECSGGMALLSVNGLAPESFDLAMINSITVNGSTDDDLLTVDFSSCNGVPTGGVTFNGGGQDVLGDALLLQGGGPFATIEHTFDNASDGGVNIDGSLIAYTGLEPVFDNLDAADRLFTFNGGTETITLSDDGGAGDGFSLIDSTLGESVTFANPTNSLTVNAGGGSDLLDVFALDSLATLPGGLFLNGGDGDDDFLVDASTVYATSADGEAGTDEFVYALGSGTLSGTLASGTISGSGLADVAVANFEAALGICQPGVDAFGYAFEDSNCGAVLANFTDISGTGTDTGLAGDDDNVMVALPFAFNFYGVDFSNIFVSANGLLSFAAPGTAFTNVAIPTAAAPNALIAPFWDDLDPSVAGTIYTETQGASPNQVFIVQWDNVAHQGGTNPNSGRFQALLFEGSNEIEFQYESLGVDGGNYTIGIENPTGTIGAQYAFGTALPLPQPFAVRFVPGTPPAQISIDDVMIDEDAGTASFTITSDSPVSADVTVDFATMDGTAEDENGAGDYLSAAGTATILSGASAAVMTVDVSIIDDALFEGDETFTVVLSNATGPAVIADGSGLGTILDNETPPCLMGGPDAFGYTFEDSNCGTVALDFEDISGTGTDITGVLGDDSPSAMVALPFTFNFYGANFTEVFVNPNGNLTFGAASSDAGDAPLPAPAEPDNLIALFWDDLDPAEVGTLGTVHHETLGTAPNRRFIVQYTNLEHFASGGGGADSGVFQVKLLEATQEIEMQYLDANGDGTSSNTVGIQNGPGTSGLTYKSDNSDLFTPLAILFTPPAVPPATLSIDDVSVPENGGPAVFTVSSSVAVASDVTVQVDTSNSSATAGLDYTAISGLIVTIPTGGDFATVSVDILDDAIFEGNETFTVTLSNQSMGAFLGDATGVGTILENETAPFNATLVDDTASLEVATDGSIGFSAPSGSLSTGGLSFNGGSAHVFESRWFYRLDGDTDESDQFATTPDSANVVGGNAAALLFNDVQGRGFDAQWILQLDGDGPGLANVIDSLSINAPAGGPDLTITLFHFVDADAAATFGNDTLTGGTDSLVQSDSGEFVEHAAQGSSAFRGGGFNADVLSLMSDGLPTTLDNAIANAGPADLGTLFQFGPVTIPAGEFRTFATAFSVNQSARLTPLSADVADFRAETLGHFMPVMVRWSTSAEVDLIGFDVYRATPDAQRASGWSLGAEPLNAQLIPGRGEPNRGADYEFADSLWTLGEDRAYFLIDVDQSGRETLHGPAFVEVVEPDPAAPVDPDGFEALPEDEFRAEESAQGLPSVGGVDPR